MDMGGDGTGSTDKPWATLMGFHIHNKNVPPQPPHVEHHIESIPKRATDHSTRSVSNALESGVYREDMWFPDCSYPERLQLE